MNQKHSFLEKLKYNLASIFNEFTMPQLLTKSDAIETIQLIQDDLDEYKDMDISRLSQQRRELFHSTIDNVKQMIRDYIDMYPDIEKHIDSI